MLLLGVVILSFRLGEEPTRLMQSFFNVSVHEALPKKIAVAGKRDVRVDGGFDSW